MVLMRDRPWILREIHNHFAGGFPLAQEPRSLPMCTDIEPE